MYLLSWKEIYMIQGLTHQKIFTWESKLYITQMRFRIFASATVTYISNRLLYLNLELLKYPFKSIIIWILKHCYMTIYNVDFKITSVLFLLNENEATLFEPFIENGWMLRQTDGRTPGRKDEYSTPSDFSSGGGYKICYVFTVNIFLNFIYYVPLMISITYYCTLLINNRQTSYFNGNGMVVKCTIFIPINMY